MKRLIAIAILALAVSTCAYAVAPPSNYEAFTVKHTAGKTIYFRFFDPEQGAGANVYTFDWDDNTWETSLGACTDPKKAATEKTDAGDGDESLYSASVNLASLANSSTLKRFVVQAVDDLGTDEVISEMEFWVRNYRRVEPAALEDCQHGAASPSNATLLLSTFWVGAGSLTSATAYDVWNYGVPGIFAAGTAGYRVGTYLTGDAYTRLGAPAGASIAADVAAVKADTAATLTDTNELQTNQGNWLTATGFSTLTQAQVNAQVDIALADVGVTAARMGRLDATVSSRATAADVRIIIP